MGEEKKTVEKKSFVETLKFIGLSLFKNDVVLEEEQRWWTAIIIFFVSLIASVGGVIYTGYKSTINAVASTTTETAIDKGLGDFARKITAEKTVYIENGSLTLASTPFQYSYISSDNLAADAAYVDTRYDAGTDKTYDILRVFFLNTSDHAFDPLSSSADQKILSSFMTNTVYQYVSSVDSASSTSAVVGNNWKPCSVMVFTPTCYDLVTYKPVAASTSETKTAEAYGSFKSISSFDFYTLAHADGKVIADDTTIVNNSLVLFNQAYDVVKVSAVWSQVAISLGLEAGVILLAGLIFWLISRSRSSILHFNFWQAFKIICFFSLSPALITFVISFFMSSYSSFIFLMCIALRMMSAVQKLSNNGTGGDDKPVYKARA